MRNMMRPIQAIAGAALGSTRRDYVDRLQKAVDLVTGRLPCTRPTAGQAAAICKVPLPSLQAALTRQGARPVSVCVPNARSQTSVLGPGKRGWRPS